MMLSELIERAQQLMRDHGDVQVLRDAEYSGYDADEHVELNLQYAAPSKSVPEVFHVAEHLRCAHAKKPCRGKCRPVVLIS